MQMQKCSRCKKTFALTTDNFRFTRGYFKYVCRDCEAKVSKMRYRKKKKLGVLKRKETFRRDISAVVARYHRIFKYLASLRIDPAIASSFEVDKVLEAAAM